MTDRDAVLQRTPCVIVVNDVDDANTVWERGMIVYENETGRLLICRVPSPSPEWEEL